MAGFGGKDILPLREKLALLVAPLCSALQALSVFLLFLRLGYSRPAASLLALFSACTFSQIVFGSIPEHFALSGLFLTCGFLLAADLLQGGEINWPLWVFIGWLTAGVTISNLALIAILFFFALRLGRRPAAFRRGSVLIAMVIAGTILSYFLLNLGYDVDLPTPAREIDRSAAYLKTDLVATLLRFPSAVANAIAPPAPALASLHTLEPAAKYRFRLTLEGIPAVFTRKNLLGSALVLLLAAGALGHCRQGRPFRPLAAVAGAVLVFNGLLHAVWGNEYFLYSQHWQMAAVFLAAGVFHFPGRGLILIPGALLGLTAATALNNMINVQLILNTLTNAP